MIQKIFIDGQFYSKEDAKISVFDHGLLYGDGVFEGIRFYNGRVFKLDEHIDRLYRCAKAIWLTIPVSREKMIEDLLETIRQNGLRDGYIRLVVTRGEGTLGLNPAQCPKPTVFIIAATIQLYPESAYENGLTVVTTSSRRIGPAALPPTIKSLNYLNNILAKIEANNAGAAEGLMLNEQGYVAECTADNIFAVIGGKVITPSASAGALGGITKLAVSEICAELGIPFSEPPVTRFDLYTADEMFLTGTAAEVAPVVRLDSREIGNGKPGPITKRLIASFRELVRTTGTAIY